MKNKTTDRLAAPTVTDADETAQMEAAAESLAETSWLSLDEANALIRAMVKAEKATGMP